jgi:hypothetical protein
MAENSLESSGHSRLLSGWHLAAALLAGLALRLYFISHFPFYSGDTRFYEGLARNWLFHHVYGISIGGKLTPVIMRMPGYPAFLAAIYKLLGNTRTAVMSVQAVLDLATCVLTALIAARLAPVAKRRLVAAIALWLAALCPFTANYTAVVLTETLAIFWTAAAILVLLIAFERFPQSASGNSRSVPRAGEPSRWMGCFFLGGLLVGAGTLVRPETPLLLVAFGLIVVVVLVRSAEDLRRVIAVGLLMGIGLMIPLIPWALRNEHTMGKLEFLAPRYAQMQGDYVPGGFLAWTQTWMVHFGEAYRVTWKLDRAPIAMDAFPPRAFDSGDERTAVQELISRYNSRVYMTPELDAQFAALASERTSRHPLRTYVSIPIERAFMIWFTPRIELLPYSGKLWPPGHWHRSNPDDFDTTAEFGIVNILDVLLAAIGAWRGRASAAVWFLVTFFLVRTAFLTQMQTVEPRYVIECFPAVIALGALAFTGATRRTETAPIVARQAVGEFSSEPEGVAIR